MSQIFKNGSRSNSQFLLIFFNYISVYIFLFMVTLIVIQSYINQAQTLYSDGYTYSNITHSGLQIKYLDYSVCIFNGIKFWYYFKIWGSKIAFWTISRLWREDFIAEKVSGLCIFTLFWAVDFQNRFEVYPFLIGDLKKVMY